MHLVFLKLLQFHKSQINLHSNDQLPIGPSTTYVSSTLPTAPTADECLGDRMEMTEAKAGSPQSPPEVKSSPVIESPPAPVIQDPNAATLVLVYPSESHLFPLQLDVNGRVLPILHGKEGIRMTVPPGSVVIKSHSIDPSLNPPAVLETSNSTVFDAASGKTYCWKAIMKSDREKYSGS